ncbi:uncharacterized protein LOC135080516 [Ostrinia nubilalis]|uniref:uncharacterized protein LOC135080516 n=1 Tax=Ostrinia nubilalis TaxID=29057 RepID=UPI0030823E94
MLKMIVLVISILGLIQSGVGQITQNGQCESLEPHPNFNPADFDPESFLGTWYEFRRSDNSYQSGDCSVVEFLESGNGYQIRNPVVAANFGQEVNSTATLTNGTNVYSVTTPSISNPYDLTVLRTDYSNYAVLYTCQNIDTTQRSIIVWELLRHTEYQNLMIPALVSTTLSVSLNVNVDDLSMIDHSEAACYELPIIPLGEPVILPGSCNQDISVVQNFNATAFQGLWHENYAYYSENSENQCARAEYTLGEEGVQVLNSQVINQALFTISGIATVASTDGSARLSVVLNVGNATVTTDLWVLATDYESYAVSYTCENLENNQQRVWSWILSRSRQLTPAAQEAVNNVVASDVVLNYAYYKPTNQTDSACFFYPEVDASKPVVFRGQCDSSIQTVQNFNPVAYEGIWHDISSYPSVFQTGTCRNAQYTLDLETLVVDVLNTQVLEESLDVTIGEAVVASTDGSGKLYVTFPIAGTNATITTDYWILDTDYTTYSLVYSCTNTNDDEKQVNLWKLSRTKQLPAAAETEIAAVMSSYDILDERYLVPVDQSTEACFFYPEPQPGVPVVFPGQCDNITVVQNFNLTLFQGIWFEIEAYPKDQQQGQCVSHEYGSGALNTLNLTSSQIVDQFLVVSDGVLSFTSTDNSAQMEININVDGEVITIPFWILDTDYEDYALAYSCVNRNADFRAVYSWKLSRTRSGLSANAVTSINSAMADVVVLGQQYYESIDQSLDACFFLPELAPGEPVILVGQCDPNITVVQDFNATRYLGNWRLIESYPADPQTGTCNQANYSPGATAGTVTVVNTQVIDQNLASITGQAVASADGTGKLTVTFPSTPDPAELWILDTDYDTYSIVYSCSNIDEETRRVWSWKMSRTRTLSQAAVEAIDEVVNSVQVLNNRYYQIVNNSDAACFYYPVPDFSSNGVTFRGQCDDTIEVMQNFSVADYLGTWRNIELYPAAFQGGSCNTAQYSLGDEVVNVLNSQVVNQTLDSINGFAVVASTDGSAKLQVTFPNVNGMTVATPLWILSTDYFTYSLAYTCVNINDDYRQVWSWKLSRTRELPAAAATIIANVMSDIEVLDQQYFRTPGHDAEACFYYPEHVPGEPVRFPGQCSDDIPVEQNFNLTMFEGIWHEIQAYPKRQQQGNCVNHQYSAGDGNFLDLVSLNVINQTLGITNGTLTFNSTDNSAKMTITIETEGEFIQIPFWIVDTDYDDYALAYACENDGEDYRYVYSWKLSRTKELSANANAAIDSAIANVDVLDQQYYEDIDQSDNACFFLPELLPGEEVVFPGQCENITVVQDFNATAYIGRWFLIESYPSVHQSGTCNDATYTPGDNDVIGVRNTQVVNQALGSISGTAVVASDDGSGKLLVTFPSSPTPSDLWILDTDYTSYSLVYSCRNLNADQRAVWSWKLSKTGSLTENANNAINQVIDTVNVLDQRYYYQVDRSEEACFYFPEPDFTRPVRFRGRCDQNIAVVQNFDAARYLGVWHNIEWYPSSFQEGTCNNAEYTLGDNGVIVFNTQVINQTLDTITGLAVPVPSENGSAILEVTFPGAPGVTPYWVLATDYDSYSLVYTCVEEDEEYKNVWSWKLSRSRQLSNASAVEIDNVVSQVQVLDDRYYRTADQSPEGCFYYPEPQPGQVVRFPGTCSNDIPVVPNFNMTLFEGIWHEIQAYPKEQQQGQCVRHEYSSGAGNTLDLISSSVSDLALGQTAGVLSFTSTDGSARLSITINSNGTDITIPFWIVDTDYANYALAYACVDEETVNDMDYRRVFSWKLSRSRDGLSTASAASIDAAIASIDVLENKYYEVIDQSAQACFFMPDLQPGEPVVFPGQCDPDIPVVQNFNAAAYLGRWRAIEVYHTEFQTGECSEANYALNTNGNVDVINTQVINETLFTMNGVAVAATDGTGKLEVTFPTSSTPSPYWILDTDYLSYALVYSCVNIDAEQRRVWAWKLARERSLSANAVAAINQVMDTVNVLDDRYFMSVEQNDEACFYYPEADGSAVVFRGQCDDNVTVVSNFNATLYQGIWYDIQSYPANFQTGTCNTATYTPNGGVLEVLNTQVVDQELASVSATAVPAYTDGSGKLVVSFPAGSGQTRDVPYWILDTDYTSYSLVYSCTNVNEETRRVTSWKLSRSQSLSTESDTAINAAMAEVQVLRQQYYLQRNHSEEACFYYPDNFGGPVIFNDGQCPPADQVNTVANFNANSFAGTWHEVERFPSELQTGACAASQFDIGTGGTSTLTHTIVFNESQLTMTGSATANANGVIAVTINNAEVNINNNLYVIATDYSEYALLYACRTLSNTSRQVYSWKLSRNSDGLSASAVATIDAIVREEVDLHRSYYEPTAQDNDACFYYPVFDTLPNAIQLPGPCPDIPAVANFNLQMYLGQWYEVQRYPQPNQRGKCNRARYSELSDTSFNVYNYQVMDRLLNSISGYATISSSDGSGALTVNLGANRVGTLSVLDTDYSSYALLYNCRNLTNGDRQVASWKLSRTRTLSDASNVAINALIATTQGLNQDYYFDTDQSEETCFYVPSVDLNRAPRFRARCDNVTGMANFDMQRYLGWWHEIEAYPADEDRGECASVRYEADGTTVRYTSTGVFDLFGMVTTGTVVADSDGRLTTTSSNGVIDEMWVLDTDYDNYALVFTCMPDKEDDEYVKVWSAKLSKTRSLSDAAQTAMATVIEDNQLLYSQFYQLANQTDDACFHYPAATGTSVVLPGQCDQNIAVQPDFDISGYTGNWYQIERYPYPEVRAASTCIGARYTLEGSGNVTVLNWEVYDDELQAIEGHAAVVGNAQLQVTLSGPDSNVTSVTNLYILETDYVSYSLAYTCENINSFERVVVVFKLSRNRELSSDATSAINNNINERQELNERYFISVEQNDDCDEPSSSFLVKSSLFLVLLGYALQMLLR